MSRSTCNGVNFASCVPILMRLKKVVEETQARLNAMETDDENCDIAVVKQPNSNQLYLKLKI